jgi:hypothetical protein
MSTRKFCKIRPSHWYQQKIKAMNVEDRLLAIYLMTSPTFEMLGLYYIPISLMVEHTGLDQGQIIESLNRLKNLDFAKYDFDMQYVWVVDMATSQVADNPNTNQIKGVRKALTRLWEDEAPFVDEWCQRHGRFGISIKHLEQGLYLHDDE